MMTFPYTAQLLDGVAFSLTFVGLPSALTMLCRRSKPVPPPKVSVSNARRRLRRLPMNTEVNVYLAANHTTGAPLQARTIDISESGAGIKTKTELPPGAVVFLKFPKVQMMGAAQVKHCVRSGKSYIAGVAFRGSMMR